MSVKNETEIEGMRRAYLRDGLSFVSNPLQITKYPFLNRRQVRFLAWLESKLTKGYDITEYEAAFRLTEFRRKNKYFQGLTYENNSASGPNAALPRYTPNKSSASLISCELPYLK